jgi:hypothetical protein
MTRTAVIKGHRRSANIVELDTPIPEDVAEVDVVLHLPDTSTRFPPNSLTSFLRSLPPGSRSKADIDRQLHDERATWPE